MCSLRSVLRKGSCNSCPLLLMFASLWCSLGKLLYSLFRNRAMRLASRAGAPRIGICPRPELHPQGRSLQFESVPEESFQVSAVGFRHAVQGISVDHDAWRVDAALVGVARSGADRPRSWRLLLRHR